MTKAEGAEAGIVHAPGRRATWFELFFDLALAAAWPHYAVAAVTAALPLVFAGYLAVPACAAAAAVQVSVSARRRAR